MANKWTPEQQSAIDFRNCSILVSAAAGSGKTAVLVERILKKVMDEENPINIDSVVIVTFTKAAAGEMRERIRNAIEKEASKHPENAHLQKQKTLIHHANITTIDSFCSMILKNHFEEIDLDPSFRIADKGEEGLLKKEAMEELLESFYLKEENGELNGEFYNFVESYSKGKNDNAIEEYIMKMYSFAMSYPFPDKWLDNCEKNYNCKSLSGLEQMPWMKVLNKDADRLSNYANKLAHTALEIVKLPEGPYMFEPLISDYEVITSQLCNCTSYAQRYDIIKLFKSGVLSRAKDDTVSSFLREEVKRLREEVKNTIGALKSNYYFCPPDVIRADLNNMRDNIHMLITLVKEFICVYAEKKREKNLLDFSDIEHFALQILVDENGEPTKTAKEYAEYFDEVMIDEYQDSNYIQEMLLSSVSKRYAKKENVFMVGDAKQSIYRFRLARPEIFTEKYDSYSTTEGDKRRIDLFKNFRSRSEVLFSVNYLFESIMKKSLGRIEYDDEAALYPGAEFEETENNYNTELMLFDKESYSKDEDVTMNGREFEARLIAMKIKQMVLSDKPFMVTDKVTKELRPARFKDIAILVRSNSSLAEACVKVFEAQQIPLFVPSKNGYFDTIEIDTILNFLKIVDNPQNDIPFVAILKSPIVGISENDLAVLKLSSTKRWFYKKTLEYIECNEDELAVTLKNFIEMYEYFREQVNILPLHEFLWLVLDKTGYGNYICAMPGGKQRKANMDAFIKKALDFEKTSYIGIFQFVQYIEQIKKYSQDEGEVSIINEQDDTVKIMTIHKSKGLEFPIVFVSGLGSRFNRQDERAEIIMHPDLGAGMNYVDANVREKRTTILKQLISRNVHLESMGEELRVLYVALTRAKEKLILTGGVNKIADAVKKATSANISGEIDTVTLSDAGSFMEWILAGYCSHKDFKGFWRKLSGDSISAFKTTKWNFDLNVNYYTVLSLVDDELESKIQSVEEHINFENLKKDAVMPQKLSDILEFEYPHKILEKIPVKVSVSELKKQDYEENSGISIIDETKYVQEFDDIEADAEESDSKKSSEEEIIYPEFIKNSEFQTKGSDVGTMYHDFFEKLDYSRASDVGEIKKQADELFDGGYLDDRLRSKFNPYLIEKFVDSDVGKRMKRAFDNGLLWREQAFVLGVSPKEILIEEEIKSFEQYDYNENILVQGIIDAFFEEDGELVVVDYKTDYIEEGSEELLVRRYKKQMQNYKMALERLFEKNVKESIIYSVRLGKQILL